MDIVRAAQFDALARWRARYPNDILGITIGNFDGIHRGHQQLFSTLTNALSQYREAGKTVRAALTTFVPHPRIVLQQLTRAEVRADPKYWVLAPFRQKVTLAADFSFDALIAIRFTEALSRLTPEQFVRKFLVESLRVSVVVIGHDWSFGKGRAGNPETLVRFGDEFGFKVIVVPPFDIKGTRVSSSTVKSALANGDLSALNDLLGRNYSLIGRVTDGNKRGHQLGFPTVNQWLPEILLPPNGVYATKTRVQGKTYLSVTNIGVRPTFGESSRQVETHILDLGETNLYQKHVEVEFVARLREERKFPNVTALQQAITEDIRQARELLRCDT